ncbi:MAG: heme-degrading monooxygenase HmoA [Verrucomicrobiales bacterium]|jgi:heme-degrading monooxygenase HmoA
MSIATTPEPPYYAVIFTSTLADDYGYSAMGERMIELASQQPGFLGIETTRGEDGLGITVSYWTDEAAISAWKQKAEHRGAQKLGHESWYADFALRVAKVERAYTKETSLDC